jgi:flagellar FliJ protein
VASRNGYKGDCALVTKSRDGIVRLKRFQVREKRRQVGQIEAMIAEFERMARDLDDQVVAEQERSGIRDASHFAYPTFAKAAIQRRDNLTASVEELKGQLAAAVADCSEAEQELEKLEAIAGRDQDRGHEAELARTTGG